MSREYLNDMEFLRTLDEMRIKEHFIKLQVMNFKEEPIRQIQGIATAGTVTVNGASAVRRTLSLTLVAPNDENDISNIDNIISANKKIKVEIGLRNPLATYKHYGDMIWFPIGVFVITEATSSTTATSATITIKGKDKMCMLDGTCGGVLPATVTFHETQTEDEWGDVQIEQIPIFTIIKECVRHYGKEIEQNIIINDVDLIAKQSIKYIGTYPIWFTDDYSSFIISETAPDNSEFLSHKFVYGQDIGYMETDFTFPGELVFEAGQTVVEVLDKIIQTIGNYEYFYDLDGRFIFQQKKNYLNNYYTPIIELDDSFYVKAFSDTKYYKTLDNAKDSLSYFNSPKYDNIKNDFVVWGSRTNASGVTKSLKYHVAIDEKPYIELAGQWMWEVSNYKDGKKAHLYYLFDENNTGYDEMNVPEPKPIELYYDGDNTTEEQLLENIVQYLNDNYVNYTSYEASFILYLRVYWGNEIRYYKASIKNKSLEYIEYLDIYTDTIKKQSFMIGIYLPPEEESDEEGDNYVDWTDEIDPGMDTENKYDETVDSDDGFSVIRPLNDSSLDEEEVIQEKYYLLLQLKDKELGYYNLSNEWVSVYTLKEDKMSIDDLESIYSLYKTNKNIRIFVPDNYEDKYNNLNVITSINNSSGIYMNDANPQDVRQSNGTEIFNANLQFVYKFEDVLDSEDNVSFSATNREKLISGLIPYYLEDSVALVNDIGVVIDLANNEEYNNLLPWTDEINPDMDTENKYENESNNDSLETTEKTEFSIISNEIGKLIYDYYFVAEMDDFANELLLEMFEYYYNYKIIISQSSNQSSFIQEVIVYQPELIDDFDYEDNFYYTLIGKPCKEWREELYRQALLNQESASETGYYDEELLAFWRENFDTLNEEWKSEWEEQIGSEWEGWNPAICIDPGLLNFWLDFIDSPQLITSYSVNQIGRRTKAVIKDNIKMLYKLEVPDIIFIENTGDSDVLLQIEEYQILGQEYCAIKPSQMKYFISSSTGSTAFDLIREMLYTYLYYNISVTVNCVPKYYLEPNNIIYISDSRSNIYGDFVISQYTLPLTYNGNMSINTNQAMVRV